MSKLTSILYEASESTPEQTKRQKNSYRDKRIDIEFERTIVRCGIGCIVSDIDLTEADYVRLHLAFSRLIKAEREV